MFIDVAADSCHLATDDWERPDTRTREAFAKYASANVGDAMRRFGLMHSSISSRSARCHCVGAALPILTREGDNLAVHRALDHARPGDVLVINGSGDDRRAVFGE